MKPPWLTRAERDLGIVEVPGREHHPRVVAYHQYTTLQAKDDETAWCSSACCAWFEEEGIRSTRSAAAKSWLNWGVALSEPKEGCVCVIRQRTSGPDAKTGSTSGYHVGLWIKEQNGRVYLHGGNQSNSVKVSGFNLASYEICGYRWPAQQSIKEGVQ